jgi:hypothetical protein
MCCLTRQRMMRTCPEGPASHLTSDDTREKNAMYPGPNDTDWQVAQLEHRQAVAVGQYQQFVATALASTSNSRPMSTVVRHKLGTLLVRTGQRLQHGYASERPRGTGAGGQRASLRLRLSVSGG